MPPIRIPGTDKVIFVNKHIGDINVALSNFPDLDNSLKNEDIVVVGDFVDYSGSGTKGPTEVMLQGITNELQDSLHALAAGEDFDNVTDRGNRSATHRQRPKIVNINLD